MKNIPKVVNKLTNIIPIRGRGCWIWDKNNNKYLDLTSGIGALSTGHSHPYLIEKVTNQLNNIVHAQQNCFTTHLSQQKLIKKMMNIIPVGLDNFFFVNSGSEAVDNSIKIARHYTNKTNIIALNNGFHGRTIGAMSITSSRSAYKRGCQPLMPGTFFCNNDDKDSLDEIFLKHSDPNETAAIIMEPIFGEGGIMKIDDSFMEYVRTICNQNNIMMIVDEVQTGAGRTGNWWGHTNKIQPDIMLFAKGIASGFPLAGLVTKEKIINNVSDGLLGGTYGGNAVCSEAACATIDIINNENLLDNCILRGNQIYNGINSNKIVSIRQYGLMIGIEFENNMLANKVKTELLNNNIMVLLSGANNNIIRLLPPLIIDKYEVNLFLEKFNKILKDL